MTARDKVFQMAVEAGAVEYRHGWLFDPEAVQRLVAHAGDAAIREHIEEKARVRREWEEATLAAIKRRDYSALFQLSGRR